MKPVPLTLTLFIFDWSGVVSDDRKPVYEASARILRQFGKPVPTFEDMWRNATMTALQCYREAGITENAEILVSLFKQYFNEAVERGTAPTVYKEAPETFTRLKERGKRIAVLSAHPEEFVKREARAYGLFPHISHIQGQSHNKEEDLKDMLNLFTSEDQAHAIYVGDTVYDIRAAKALRVASVGMCGGYHPKERLELENPDFLFNTLSEITKLV